MSEDENKTEVVDLTVPPEPAEKERADFLPGCEPDPQDVPFSDEIHQIVVRVGVGSIGQTLYQRGDPLAEVRLATGVTLGQLLAAIRNNTAGAPDTNP